MFANSLTREAGLRVGPIILETLIKHYFDRVKRDAENEDEEVGLKQGNVLYHEAFTLVKAFLNASTSHTVEELQEFSNVRTPSPPWTHVIRTLIPMSVCEEAAAHLINALGGEDVAKKLVGGVKWWQVRGVNGIDAQWITSKKDWQEAKRRHKMQQEQAQNGSPPLPTSGDHGNSAEDVYDKDMDAMRCILYLHGGGYYFGSVDQERRIPSKGMPAKSMAESLVRNIAVNRYLLLKAHGPPSTPAINYRLAPQYPFPCALQDALAAYLYLIRPPPDSEHQAVNPAHILVGGDSAGGGLALALLQVIRDSGLPPPAGGILISPWCDLTHSFPSVHLNTDSDIIADSGLSFHKPSILWPPPSDELSYRVHASLRTRIRHTLKLDESQRFNPLATFLSDRDAHVTTGVDSTPVPRMEEIHNAKIVVTTESGETIEVGDQLHFYTQNHLLEHPLVSPATSYLGGLPPLLFIAGDKEVLRDEIIYTAHKAANPGKYPVTDRVRQLYPSIDVLLEAKCKPTSVHLQVYDDTPHIHPVIFPFTTPAKFCFRAIATFSKFVTDMSTATSDPTSLARAGSQPPNSPSSPLARRHSIFSGFKSTSPRTERKRGSTVAQEVDEGWILPDLHSLTGSPSPMDEQAPVRMPERISLRRALSSGLSRAGSVLISQPWPASPEPINDCKISILSPGGAAKDENSANSSPENRTAKHEQSTSSSDVGGPRFEVTSSSPEPAGIRFAGQFPVYSQITDHSSWDCPMIGERISTQGVVRPLEPEAELDCFQMAQENVGRVSERTIRRYLKDREAFHKRFSRSFKSIEKHRRQNLERAKHDTIKRLGILRQTMRKDDQGGDGSHTKRLKETVMSPGWGWAWALDESEEPPPSSIVSRRDTEEARKLAEVADQAVMGEDQTFSANNLWSIVINFLTAAPGKQNHVLHKTPPLRRGSNLGSSVSTPELSRMTHKPKWNLSRLFHGE